MLRPEVRSLYGAQHRRLRAAVIRELGNRCQICKREHPRINLAHLTHDALDARSVTLLCPSCHAKYDSKQRHAMTRRTRARRVGQFWLHPSLEWAPYSSWEIPERVRDRATQQLLFS